MNIKYYSFAGISVRLISDTPVYDSRLFDNFRCDKSDRAEMTVEIIHSSLPAKSGNLIFSDDTSSYYIKNKKSFYYTSYPSAGGIKQLACRVIENGKIILYVIDGQELWDSLVAFAVNYTQLLFFRGIAAMHSSCIDVNGNAVLFAGDKGAGKSTQADLWNRFRNAQIVNGDRIAIKKSKNGITAYGIPFCGSSQIALNKVLPVKAIVLLGKSKSNVVCRLGAADAFKSVISKLTYNAEDAAQLKTAVDTAGQIAENVPVFSLVCVPDESSVKILEEQLCLI